MAFQNFSIGIFSKITNLSSPPAGHILFPILFLLTGCENRSIDTYLYGPAQSCYMDTPFASVENCKYLRVYDKLVIQASTERQEVVYMMKGLGLDESNSVFGKLDNCKVIDRDNFSCDGLIRIDRRFVNTDVFAGKMISNSYSGYLISHFVQSNLKKAVLEFLDNNDTWIAMVAIFVSTFLILGLLG